MYWTLPRKLEVRKRGSHTGLLAVSHYPMLPVANVGFREAISLGYLLAMASPAAVRRGLVRNLPGTIDPNQVVKVDPTATRFL